MSSGRSGSSMMPITSSSASSPVPTGAWSSRYARSAARTCSASGRLVRVASTFSRAARSSSMYSCFLTMCMSIRRNRAQHDGSGGDGYHAELGGGDEQRVVRQHPDRVAERAGALQRHAPFVAVQRLAVADEGHRDGLHLVQAVLVVDAAVSRLHADVGG